MELTVVIVNYRVKYLLEQTLRSVEQAMKGVQGEVIVRTRRMLDLAAPITKPSCKPEASSRSSSTLTPS